jgi:hypothetical protein
MSIGPLELLILGFEKSDFHGDIAPAIKEAVDSGAIRIVDLLFVRKDAEGTVTALEIEEADDAYARDFEGLVADVRDILTEDEAMTLAELLPVDTAAMVALVEHLWASRISEAVANAGGRLLASQRISSRLLQDIGDEIETLMATPGSRAG